MGQKICHSKECLGNTETIREIFLATAAALEKLADGFGEDSVGYSACTQPQVPSRLTSKQIYDARREVDKIMNMRGFSATPAFDTMLDLHINAAADRAVSVSSACIGAACPPTTALRWLHVLENLGLIGRSPDPFDHRRAFLSLTTEGATKIEMAIAQYGCGRPTGQR